MRTLPAIIWAGVMLVAACDPAGGTPPASVPSTTGSSSNPCNASAEQSEAVGVVECQVAVASGESPVIDDFEDGDLLAVSVDARLGSWYFFSDGTNGCFDASVEADAQGKALHLTGSGFGSWGAGFGTAMRWSSADQRTCLYDAGYYAGLRFRARGNASLRLNVSSEATTHESLGGTCAAGVEQCFDQHGRSFELTSSYQDYSVSFCDLVPEGWGGPKEPLDFRRIVGINLLIQSQQNFEVWFDDLEFIEAEGKSAKSCEPVCPLDQLANRGIEPQFDETWVDTETTGVELFTFEEETQSCGALTRRYLTYVPAALEEESAAPVVVVLHGYGGDAESMHDFMTQRSFEGLADRDGFIVVYGNAAPGGATQSELPNGGAWSFDGASEVDDQAYLSRVLADLSERSLISGDNPLFLVGLSNGGGMAFSAALAQPELYQGIALVMPYAGLEPAQPDPGVVYSLERVLLAYTDDDPGHRPDYNRVIEPLGPAWASALGIADSDVAAAQEQLLPDRVVEGEAYTGSIANALATRDSRVTQLDYGSGAAEARVRVLRFDHAGHFWPVPEHRDSEAILAEYGLRNQDIDTAEAVWEFFKSSL